MKFFLIYVIVLLSLSINEVLSVAIKGSGKLIHNPTKSIHGIQDDPPPPPADYCANKTKNNGKQIPDGFCSDTVQGDVPSIHAMTSTLIISPTNEEQLQSNTVFTVKIAVANLETGSFSEPENQYYSQPQGLNDQGVIQGHSHITIQNLDGTNQPPDAGTFAFFNGLNAKSADGTLSVDVTGGLPAGRYRVCTMASSFTHQPVIMPIAKRGSQDDCVRITVSDPGNQKPKKKE